jgi:hypothetical protein
VVQNATTSPRSAAANLAHSASEPDVPEHRLVRGQIVTPHELAERVAGVRQLRFLVNWFAQYRPSRLTI